MDNAKYNENFYNHLTKEEQSYFIEKVYETYNKTLPLIEYDLGEIKKYFEMLKMNQPFTISKNINTNLLKKYKLEAFIEFINKLDKNNEKNITFIDVNYVENYVKFCSLSDFYQNEERVKCCVQYQKSPMDYYKENYKKILHSYFSKQSKYYEKGFFIEKISNTNFNINPIFLQTIQSTYNKFCTVYKPYLFKLFIQLFKAKYILDLSSGWGDRLLASISQESNIKQYIGIDPNEKLFKNYYKMISDLSNDKNKYILINKPSQDVEFLKFHEMDIIFWSPPFEKQEEYITDTSRDDFKNQSINTFTNYDEWETKFLIYTINQAINILKIHGVLILYIGNINYKSFISKMNQIKKLKFIDNIIIKTGNKTKNYMIYSKVQEPYKVSILEYLKNDKILNEIQTVKTFNPDPVIQKILINDKKINVIQDAYLVAGTKTRVCVDYVLEILKNKNIDTITYCGTYNGFGAVACALSAFVLKIKCKIFISKIGTGFNDESDMENILKSRQIKTLRTLGVEIYLCDNYRTCRNLQYDFSDDILKEMYQTKKNYFNVPMGFNDTIMIKILSQKMKDLKLSFIKRLFLVAGSGGILESLYNSNPNIEYYVYLTGGGKYILKVMDFIKHKKNIHLMDEKLEDIQNTYYESVKNYDDKIIKYLYKYGKDGDYVWNVGSDNMMDNTPLKDKN